MFNVIVMNLRGLHTIPHQTSRIVRLYIHLVKFIYRDTKGSSKINENIFLLHIFTSRKVIVTENLLTGIQNDLEVLFHLPVPIIQQRQFISLIKRLDYIHIVIMVGNVVVST